MKTIAAFLNAGGGTLLIGVADDGGVVSLAADGFANEDKMGLHLVNLIRDRIGDLFLPYVHPNLLTIKAAEFFDPLRARSKAGFCEGWSSTAFLCSGSKRYCRARRSRQWSITAHIVSSRSHMSVSRCA